MALETLSQFTLADLTLEYRRDPTTGVVGMRLFPTSCIDLLQPRRGWLETPEVKRVPMPPPPAEQIEPLVQLKLLGHQPPAERSQGLTLRHAESTTRLVFVDQQVSHEAGTTVIVTRLELPGLAEVEHHLEHHTYREGVQAGAVYVHTRLRCIAPAGLSLEMLSSFTLGNITPFAPDDAPERLRVHRFRSAWSGEGRLVSESVEALHLERSWLDGPVSNLRFGQVGSMAARGYFPTVAVEDTVAGVTWGVQLACASSWQLELSRRDDALVLSGGLADREFGHWVKHLENGEQLITPEACLSVVQGDVDAVCGRLVAHQRTEFAPETTLGVQFNEYCTSWGSPTHDSVLALAQALQGTGVEHLVIDAGWYRDLDGGGALRHGDWLPSLERFPHGLEATAAAVRSLGLVPGLWFEWELCGTDAEAYSRDAQHLRLDGIPLEVRGYRHWNFQDPWVLEHLTDRVMGLLERGGFGYLKLDYNTPLGLGCDHPDSPGEGLRLQLEGVQNFLRRIRQRLPDLVIECCASGGQRLEPSMLALCELGSSSDAHELAEAPIIAANLQRLIPAHRSLVWAVLRAQDSLERALYTLATAFLGRMCLSGELLDLSPEQRRLLDTALHLYPQVAPLLLEGYSQRLGPSLSSYRYPRGWQGVLRIHPSGNAALCVLHSFSGSPEQIEVRLLEGYRVKLLGNLMLESSTLILENSCIRWTPGGDYQACVLHLHLFPLNS